MNYAPAPLKLSEEARANIDRAGDSLHRFWNNSVAPAYHALLANPAHAKKSPQELVQLAYAAAAALAGARDENVKAIREVFRKAELERARTRGRVA